MAYLFLVVRKTIWDLSLSWTLELKAVLQAARSLMINVKKQKERHDERRKSTNPVARPSYLKVLEKEVLLHEDFNLFSL